MSKNYNCYHVLDQIFLPCRQVGPLRLPSSPFVSLRLPNGLFARLHLIKYKRAVAVHRRELESRALAGPLLLLQRAHPCHQVRPRALLEDTNIQDGAVAGP